MASASVVGQHQGPHRLDSETQLLFFKLVSGRKKMTLPRKSSLEKMMFRKSSTTSGTVTSEAAGPGSAASWKSPRCSISPALAGENATTRGELPREGCAALPADAPRRADRDREEGIEERSTITIPVSRGSQRRQIVDRNQNIDCDLNQNTCIKMGTSHKKTIINVTPSALVANGHKGARSHSDLPQGRRAYASQGTNNGQQSVSARNSAGEAGGLLPLERLTQGRTGVVRLARTEPQRREAWAIFTAEGDPRVKTERGEGHRFNCRTVPQDWCDVCNCQITAQVLKCQNCSYTCHLECESNVQLDCNQRDKRTQESTPPRGHCSIASQHKQRNEVKAEEEGGTKALSEEEMQTRIAEYNAQISENGMKLGSDGSYTGFINVHLRLSRPVTVPAALDGGLEHSDRQSRLPTSAEGHEETNAGVNEKRTSFYLPRDCVKQLHISSTTTAREVIQGLLKKFMVRDNPRKFALYRQTHRDGQDLFQKLPLCECPLLLRLLAGPDPKLLSFVLKENETGEVEWHAFSVPELQNFLVILEKEEAERIRTVEQKYFVYRQKLQRALRQHDP